MSQLTTMECVNCPETFDVNPRPRDWPGKVRWAITCPHCKYTFRHKSVPKGVVSTNEPVSLIDLRILLCDYDCTVEQATSFAANFKAAWEKISTSARSRILDYWSTIPYAPVVFLLNDRAEWGGTGWAGADPKGTCLYFPAPVVLDIPSEHVQLFVSHELAHVLSYAANEPNHRQKPRDLNSQKRAEMIVWHFMKAWRFGQDAAELWMRSQFLDDAQGLRKRDQPLPISEVKKQFEDERGRIFGPVDFTFPACLEQFCI